MTPDHTEREREREAIVAWLRSGDNRPSISNYYEDMRGQYVHDLADAIEARAHLGDGAQGGGRDG